MDFEDFGNLIPDSVHRSQRRQRILEDHGDVLAAVLAHFLIAQTQQFGAVVCDRPGNIGGRRVKPHNRHRCHGFTRTGFANDTQGFTGVKVKIDAAHRMYNTVFGIEANVQVFNTQNGRSAHEFYASSFWADA